jgi:lactam utilization protein B
VLTEGHVGVSGASRGERIGEWSVQMQVEELVTVALANLSLGYNDTTQEDMSSTLAMASARISRLAAQHTRSTHE